MTMISGRQKIGVALILIALIGAVFLQIAAGKLLLTSTTEETRSIGGHGIYFQTTVQSVKVPWRYAAPIMACAAAGLCCLLIPRRPSKSGPPPLPH